MTILCFVSMEGQDFPFVVDLFLRQESSVFSVFCLLISTLSDKGV